MRLTRVERILSILSEEQRIGEIDDSLTRIIFCGRAKAEDELSDDALFHIAAARSENRRNPSSKPHEKE